MADRLLSVTMIDGCPECDAGPFSVEHRRYDMGGRTQSTLQCQACGWHDMSIFDDTYPKGSR